MKNILLCDANFCVLPILQILKKKNYNTSVVGALLSDPGHKIANNSIPINYANKEQLLDHISNNNYDFIVPGCNDQSYLSLSYIAEKLSYPGFDKYETTLLIHHKNKFKEYAIKKDYPIPKEIENIKKTNEIKFPVIIKPIDSFSGKGIKKAFNREELNTLWKELEKDNKTQEFIIEEFIEGELYSHSAFIKNKKIVLDFFVNEYCTVYPYQVNSSNLSTLLNKKIKEGMKNWTEKFAQDLELCDGLIHTQFISDNEDFYILEVARRCPGDLYSQLIKESTGIDYNNLYTLPFIGIELPEDIRILKTKFISRHTVSVDKPCIFLSSEVTLENKKTKYIPLKYSGTKMDVAPFDKSGIYFIEHDKKSQMEKLTKKLKEYIIIEDLDIETHEGN